MKTRRQIIDEIIKQHMAHNPTTQVHILEVALKGLQDAILFSLAADLNIEIIESESELCECCKTPKSFCACLGPNEVIS